MSEKMTDQVTKIPQSTSETTDKQTMIKYIICDNNFPPKTSTPSSKVDLPVSNTKVIYIQPSATRSESGKFTGPSEAHTVYARTYGQYISQQNRGNEVTTNVQGSHNGQIYFVSPDGSMRQAANVPSVLQEGRKQPQPTIMPGTNIEYRTPGASFVNKNGKIKRPMNAFMLWARTYRSKLAQEMPNASNSEISIRLGQIWAALPITEKQDFYLEAERIKNRHRRDFPDWVYQPRKTKKMFGFSEIQHNRLWEKYSDQYTKPLTPTSTSSSQIPTYRPIVPAPAVSTGHNLSQNALVTTSVSGMSNNGVSLDFSQHFDQFRKEPQTREGSAMSHRPETVTILPNSAIITGKKTENGAANQAHNQQFREEKTPSRQQTMDDATISSPKKKMKKMDDVTDQMQQNKERGLGDNKQTKATTALQFRKDKDDRQDFVWPFPLPAQEPQNPVHILFEEAVQPEGNQRQGYTDLYDPFYYKGHYDVCEKQSSEHLSVDVSSWQQYLNDTSNVKEGSDSNKQQLGTYFNPEPRKCPSDLDICPTPVGSSLYRSDSSHDNSRILSQKGSVQAPIVQDTNSIHNEYGYASNLSGHENIGSGECSDQGSTLAGESGGTHCFSFGSAMSHAVQVLNGDMKYDVSEQISEPDRQYFINEPTTTSGNANNIQTSYSSNSLVHQEQGCGKDLVAVSSFHNQDTLPLKKRTERIYQGLQDEHKDTAASDGAVGKDKSLQIQEEGKELVSIDQNENCSVDRTKTYEITVTRSMTGDEITETTIYLPKEFSFLDQLRQTVQGRGKDVALDGNVNPVCNAEQADENMKENGSCQTEDMEDIPKINVPTKRGRERM